MYPLSLRRLVRLAYRSLNRPQRSRRDPDLRCHPSMELLEDRSLLATVTWCSPNSGAWENAANWCPNQVPGPDDDVVIDIPGSVTISHSGNSTVKSLAFSGGMIQGTADVLTITDLFDWTSGALSGTGTTNIGPAGELSINSPFGVLASGRILNNAGYADWTHGDISFSSQSQFNNLAGATFDIQSDARLGGTPLQFHNQGTLRSVGSTHIGGSGIFWNDPTGIVQVESGALVFDQQATYNRGVFRVADGAWLDLVGDADFLYESSLVTGGGTLAFFGTHEHLDGAWDFTGTTIISSYTADALGQAPIRMGALVLDQPSTGGYINFDGGAGVTVGTLTISRYSTLRGSDDITVTDSLTTANSITMSGVGSITVLGGSSSLAGMISGFKINLEGETSLGGITLSNGATINNKSRGESTLHGGAGYISGSGTLNNTGTVVMVGINSYPIDAGVSFSNNGGTLSIQSGTLAFAGTYVQNAGTTAITAGATLKADGLVDIEDGILSGSGTVDGSVYNAGEVDPGGAGATGVLTVTGDYTQAASGVLNIEIGGPNPATDFDRLVVSGRATLSGTLAVSLFNGYVPESGDSFQVLTFGSVSGDFVAYDGLDLGGGLYFDPQYSDSGLTLVTMSSPPSRPELTDQLDMLRRKQPAGGTLNLE